MSSFLAFRRHPADVRSVRRQLEEAEYLLDRTLGHGIQATLGERVRIKPEHLQRPDQEDLTFEIVEVIDVGETQMLVLRDESGVIHKYFRPIELFPAASPTPPTKVEKSMIAKNASEQLMQLSDAIAKSRRVDLRTALRAASRERPDLAEAHRLGSDTALVTQPTRPAADVSGNRLLTLANQIAGEQQISLRDAVKVAASRDPVAVGQYQMRFNCGGRG